MFVVCFVYSEISRRKGLYLRCICGIRKGLIQGRRICFLTLNTNSACCVGLSDDDMMYAIGRDWNIFRTYLHQLYGDFDFISVITNEGYGVIHILLIGFPFVYFKTLCRMWASIHGMGYAYITKFKGSAEKMADYLMSQYLSDQDCKFRFKMSQDFICKRFVFYWRIIKNCSRDYTVNPVWMSRWVYPVKRGELKTNYIRWIDYYIRKKVCLEYVP